MKHYYYGLFAKGHGTFIEKTKLPFQDSSKFTLLPSTFPCDVGFCSVLLARILKTDS